MRLYTTTALALVAAALHSPVSGATLATAPASGAEAKPANPLVAPMLPNASAASITKVNDLKGKAFLHVDLKPVLLKEYMAARAKAVPKALPANLVRFPKAAIRTKANGATRSGVEAATGEAQLSAYRAGAATAAEPPADIDALARALKHDPDLIYEFVRDNIEVTPVYGIQKGAWGALIDRQGSNFDQVELMVRLLRASGYKADFLLGVIELSAAQVQSYFGISTSNTLAVRDYFASGQTPSEFTFSGADANSPLSSALLQHMWAKVTINGQDFDFDPSLKAHTVKPGIGIAAASSYAQAAYLADAKAGAAVTATSARNLNRANVRTRLSGYATSLIANIRANTPAAGLDDIIGGKSITQNEQLLAAPTRTVNLPVARYDYGGTSFPGEIPSDFRTIIQVVFGSVNVAFLADDFYGRRLTVAPNANNEPQLIADGEVIATGTQLPLGYFVPLQVGIEHLAYTDINADQTIARPLHGSETFAISYALGTATNRSSKTYREQAQAATAAGNSESSEPVLGSILSALGADLQAQMGMSMHITDRAANANTQLHHSLGLVSQYDGAPNINFTTSDTVVQQDRNEARRIAAVISHTMHGSALESGVLEQTTKIPAVSTIHFIDQAVTNGETIYSATSANWASEVRPNLVGCSSAEADGLQTYPDAGWRLILPSNCRQVQNDWVGSGVFSLSPDVSNLSIGMTISGGYNGGFCSSRNCAVGVPQIVSREPNLKRTRKLRGDPVDMSTGAFVYSHNDLVVGRGDYPEALSLTKSYNSNALLFDGPLGRGWSFNYAMKVTPATDAYQGLGEDSPIDAAASIVDAMVTMDLLSDPLLPFDKLTIAMLGHSWWADELNNNTVNVSTDVEGSTYVKLPDGTYNSPPENSSKLIKNADGTFTQSLVDKTVYQFDASGNVTARKQPNGVEVRFDYTGGKLSNVRNSFGRSLALTYVGDRISSVQDGTGRSVSYAYDASGNLTSFTDAAGKSTTFEYDLPGRLSKFFLPANPVLPQVSNVYDGLGRISQQTDADGKLWQYFLAGTRGELVSPLGNRVADYFDGDGHVLATIEDLNSPAGSKGSWQVRRTINKYDGLGRLATQIDSRAPLIQLTYDDASCNSAEKRCTNNVKTRVQRAMHTSDSVPNLPDIISSFTYEAQFNKLATATSPRGKVTNYGYDPTTGNLVSVTLPPPVDGGTVRSQTSYAYTTLTGAAGLPNFTMPASSTKKIDATNSVTTSLTYDAANGFVPRTQTVDSGGLNLTTSYGFDPVGNQSSVDGPRSDVSDITTMAYDAERRPVLTTDALGKATQATYNVDGDTTGIAAQVGSQWLATCYDRLPSGKASRIVGPGLVASADSCPAAAAPTSVTDLAYDDDGRLLTNSINLAAIEGGNRVSKFEYTPSGERVATTKAVGTPLEQSDPKVSIFYTDRTMTSTFDATTDYRLFSANNAGSGADAGSKHLTFDGHGRLHFFWPGGGGCPSTTSGYGCEQYAYDADGNVITWTRRDGQIVRFVYDNLNRVTQKTAPTSADTVVYTYDLLDRVLSAKYGTNGASVTYAYDKANRVLSTTAAARTIGYQYDSAGNKVRTTWPDSAFYVTYDHDALGRVTAVKEKGTTLLAAYGYDDLSRRTGMTYGNATGVSLAYDGAARLATLSYDLAGTAADVTRTYGHDQAGGITSIATSNPAYDWNGYYNIDRPYTNDGEDKYLTSGAKTLTYDNRANLIGDGTWTFAYDAQNRLKSAVVKNVTSLTYTYDPVDRLSNRKLGTKGITNYLYDGDQLLGEYSSTGALIRRYVRGPGVDEPLVIYDGTGAATKTFLYGDHQGSITATADAAGTPLTTLSYGPFGEPSTTVGVALRYTGQQLDPDSGLYYYKARWYSPYMGRFLSPDPTNINDGMHLYRYVGNDPINYSDGSGLCRQTAGVNWNQQLTGAGLGALDGVTFGLGSEGIEYFTGKDLSAETNSTGYLVGTGATFTLGAARLAYMGIAKSFTTLSGAEAVAARNALKQKMSGLNLVGKTHPRTKTYEELLKKYGSDEAVAQAAGRTNTTANAAGGATVTSSGISYAGAGC